MDLNNSEDSQKFLPSATQFELEKQRSSSEIFEDSTNAKLNTENGKASDILNINLNLEEEIDALNKYGDSLRKELSFWGKTKRMEFEVNFNNRQHMVYMLGIFAAFAGILSGIDQSIISGASIGMNQMLNLTTHEASLVSSLMPLGAVAGSILLTPFSEYFGRRKSLVISCVFYTIGAIICAAAKNQHEMYAGRFLVGVGVGLEGRRYWRLHCGKRTIYSQR
ncbi:hypothetical protein QA23_5133 [Saccharomyces cerevisiae Lalvin QA23]|nr:hypothetical protein QA23_5133 [Saccharomyces cerevisiae Lalvin QA23]